MHYYKKNIGDYHKKAGRLTMLQHGAYTLLMDACYDREKFPNRDEALDWLWASSKEEIEAVDFVLGKFFKEDEEGFFVQQRVKEEIEKYHENAATNKRIAIERETKRREKRTNRDKTVNGDSTNRHLTKNQELRTTNQEPLKELKESRQKAKRFSPPTSQEAGIYFLERGHQSAMQEAENFIDFYASKGWMVGKNKMKDWKAAIRNWMKNDNNFGVVTHETSKQIAYDKTFDIADTSWAQGLK